MNKNKEWTQEELRQVQKITADRILQISKNKQETKDSLLNAIQRKDKKAIAEFEQKIKCVECKETSEHPVYVQDWTHSGYYCNKCFERVNKGLI